MSKRTVLLLRQMDNRRSSTIAASWLILATTVALATRGLPTVAAAPTPQEDDGGNSSGPLPFIQFTKGGIRVNFGGYHAQAGLGGLLTGKSADGGLHASAGTPSGAHASAGLGGTLDGGPAGGLHARAGLGNGGPEAEAGLAGSLAGSKPEGQIVARTNNVDLTERRTKGKNIQVIKRPNKSNELDAAASSSATADERSGSDPRAKETSPPGATANAGASVNNADGEQQQQQQASAQAAAPLATSGAASTATSTETAKAAGKQPTSGPPTRKPWQYGIFARSPDSNNASGDGGGSGGKFKGKGTLFDDIFNIPISALNAVNQLLKNHVGKK